MQKNHHVSKNVGKQTGGNIALAVKGLNIKPIHQPQRKCEATETDTFIVKGKKNAAKRFKYKH